MSAEKMTREEYEETLNQVALLGRLAMNLRLREALEIAERAEAIGFLFVKPFDYQRGLKNTRDAKALINPLLRFQAVVLEMRDAFEAEEEAAEQSEPTR